ncbi:MAG: cyclic-di-AMP receptor [Tissierellales bacterium]|nr:cyclic-di-AMP receptor [Tissierellales bacterium]MBN2826611.1 cyclic-di-AMP receptor [Tissierellales bacterium]
MKLVIAVIQDEDAGKVSNRLRDEDFGLTKLASTGGFLSAGNTTLLIGVEENQVDQVLEIVKENCKTRKRMTTASMPSAYTAASGYIPRTIEVLVGGATVFVVDVDRFEKM